MLYIDQLHKSYGQQEVVKGLSLHIEKGESYGLLGPNGAGKSTTISMISGLLKPVQGSIIVGGISMIDSPKKAQQLLGVVPQEIALYMPMTAKENLMFWGRMYGLKGEFLKQRVQEVLTIIGLTDRANDKVGTFSGGMKRRVNIGAAILHNPKLLIMDEPTVGIDPQSRNHILETVKVLNEQGMTIIYTSHYMEEVEFLCQRIGIMDQGQLIAEGTIEQLQQVVGNKTSLTITIQEPIQHMDNFIQSLQHICPEENFTVQEHKLTVMSADAQRIIVTVLPFLAEQGLSVTAIDLVQPNLENVFLHLTGRSLRD
ncbi:ABC transporter ATP-binding protein [Paenibacillus endoradicis]|uniref:ABC transporter ATP-binding protein n=1 Tax=Paenibacillus endoradicis TaxID=2972487 RepID=UPI002158AA27|nr:ABC transporter ATP-binding protein [Paenibacillus endoradicis]MCR8657570.1 ABC transporter ATP-binding protein [Paenibacillus endoradicis]